MIVLSEIYSDKEAKMNRTKRVLISAFVALMFILPMLIDMPDRSLGFFIFVFPLAFGSFFTLLTLGTLKNTIYKVISFVIVSVVCLIQFYWTYIGSDFALFKALSYALVGMGVAAGTLLVLDYMVQIYNQD